MTTTGGTVQPQVSKAVVIQPTGSCGGTPTCTYTVTPTARSFTGEGGTGSFTVSTQTGCGWSAFENASWVNITSGATGSGTGTVSYQVSPNTGSARSVNITAGGKTHTVNQAEPSVVCTYGLPTHNGVFDPPGGNGTFQVNTNDASCAWQASSTVNWILLTNGSSHTGTGPVNYAVAENDTPHQRSGVIK